MQASTVARPAEAKGHNHKEMGHKVDKIFVRINSWSELTFYCCRNFANLDFVGSRCW